MIVSLLLLTSSAQSQQLLDPLTAADANFATATLHDGTRIMGVPKIWDVGMGTIKKIHIKPKKGKKAKLLPGDIKMLTIEPTEEAILAAAAASQDSIVESMRTNEDELLDRDTVTYLPGMLPNGKPMLMQLLNPGFDDLLQVFPDPKGKETSGVGIGGVKISGGVLKTYLVRKTGSPKTFLLKKGKYDDMWVELYGDCPPVAVPDPKVKWGKLSEHLVAHWNACGPQASAEEEPTKTITREEAPAEMEEGDDMGDEADAEEGDE